MKIGCLGSTIIVAAATGVMLLMSHLAGIEARPARQNQQAAPVAETTQPKQPEPEADPGAARIDKSPSIQAERRKLIDDLVAQGVMKAPRKTSVDIVRVVVTPRFMDLDFDQKDAFIAVVYAYHFDSSADRNMVILLDSKSDKDVGVFSALRGGLQMK